MARKYCCVKSSSQRSYMYMYLLNMNANVKDTIKFNAFTHESYSCHRSWAAFHELHVTKQLSFKTSGATFWGPDLSIWRLKKCAVATWSPYKKVHFRPCVNSEFQGVNTHCSNQTILIFYYFVTSRSRLCRAFYLRFLDYQEHWFKIEVNESQWHL